MRLRNELAGGSEADLAEKEVAHVREMIFRTFPKLSSMRETDEINTLTDDVAKVLNDLTQNRKAMGEALDLLKGLVGRVPDGDNFEEVVSVLNGIRDVLQGQKDDDGE